MTASRKRRSAERPPLDSRSALVPVVGIGGSAGAVPALKAFFSSAPADSGLSFVVVQHLDPDHRTALPELLGHATAMPARLIEDGGAAQPNHIHILPPNATLTIKDGRLRLEPPALPRGQRTPIDDFLTSLAADRGENAACVILSGTGSDGTLGLRAIKESGGLTLAQAGAEYDGMMRSAVSTGLVDFVLPAEEMAAKLVDYFSPLHAEARRKKRDGLSQDTAAYLGPLCAVLRARTGHDFSGYKYKTIIRRVLRRMQVLKIDEMLPISNACAPMSARSTSCSRISSSASPTSSATRRSSPPSNTTSCRGSSRGAALTMRSACGSRAAPPARRPTRSPSCCASACRDRMRDRSCKSSPPTSTSRRWRSPAPGAIRRRSPRTCPARFSSAISCARTGHTGWRASCAKSASSRRIICCATRPSRSSTSSPAATS